MLIKHHRISARTLAAGLVVGGLFFGLAATALVPKDEGTPLKLVSFAVDLGVSNLSRRHRLGLQTFVETTGSSGRKAGGPLSQLLRARSASRSVFDKCHRQ